MDDYQDQDIWFDLMAYDGFQWVFIADFDNRSDALGYAEASEVLAVYERYAVQRRRGTR